MYKMSIMDVSRLQLEIDHKFGVHIHIHDTCSGFDISLDQPNSEVSAYILEYMSKHGESVAVSEDGMNFMI